MSHYITGLFSDEHKKNQAYWKFSFGDFYNYRYRTLNIFLISGVNVTVYSIYCLRPCKHLKNFRNFFKKKGLWSSSRVYIEVQVFS